MDRGDVALHLEHVVDIVGETVGGPVFVAEEPSGEAWCRDVLGAGRERPQVLAEKGLAADRYGVEIGAVKGVPDRDALVAAGSVARELQRHADGGGAAGCQQHLAERLRSPRGQGFGEAHGDFAGEASRAERKCAELVLDGLRDGGVAMAELAHAVAVKIEQPAPGDRGETWALGMRHQVEAGLRERLVQIHGLVAIEQPDAPGGA